MLIGIVKISKKIVKESLLLYGLACLSGILLSFSYPPVSFGIIAWVALIPLFIAVKKADTIRRVANLGSVTGLIFYCIGLRWFFNVFGPMAIGLICALALFIAVTMVVVKKLHEKIGELWGWLLGAPVVWVGLEYFRSEVWFLRFTWFGLGFSQTANPILQTASVWGVYGISFFIVLSSAFILLGLTRRRMYLVAGICIPVVFWIFGSYRLNTFPIDEGTKINVAVIQDETSNLRKLIGLEQKALDNGAEIVVWPEYAVQFGSDFVKLKLLHRTVEENTVIRIVGGFILHGEESLKKSSILSKRKKHNSIENFALILDGKGEVLGRYDKIRPIPIIERKVVPGKKVLPVITPKGTVGIQICYDLDFEYGTRKLVKQGAQILLVPNLDPVSFGDLQHIQHSSMSAMRAVESGLWIARSASSGISQIIDPVGRVTKSIGIRKEGVIVGEAFLREGTTIYAKIGWLLAPVCLILSICLIAIILIINFWLVRMKLKLR